MRRRRFERLQEAHVTPPIPPASTKCSGSMSPPNPPCLDVIPAAACQGTTVLSPTRAHAADIERRADRRTTR